VKAGTGCGRVDQKKMHVKSDSKSEWNICRLQGFDNGKLSIHTQRWELKLTSGEGKENGNYRF
jgi:hypothetical protein